MGNFKWIVLLLFLLSFSSSLIGQEDVYKYVIYLKDKVGSPFSIDQPQEFLSVKALARRNLYSISVVENDIPVVEDYLDNITDLGYTIISHSNWLNAVLIESKDSLETSAFETIDFVKSFIWVSLELKGGRNEIVNETDMNLLLEVNREAEYGVAWDQINLVNGSFLHNNGFRGERMTIGVLDAGFINSNFVSAFDELRNENRIIATKDFVDYDDNVYESSGHGTSVLSTMAGQLDHQFLGTAPDAQYLLIKTEDIDSEQLVEEFNYVLGLEYADQMGVDIITTSLGYTLFNYPDMDHNSSDLDGNHLIASIGGDIAASKGMLVVNSAGNEGNNDWSYISFPADADSVLAVGSINRQRIRSEFSGLGFEENPQIKPNVMALGEKTAVINTAGEIAFSNGTSFSAPIISGLLACLWQAFPELNNMEIIKAVEESSSQYLSPDYYMGYGIPDFQAAFALLYQRKYNLLSNVEGIVVFPNPFSNSITITLPYEIDQPLSVELHNDIGQQLYSTQIDAENKKTVNLQFPGISALNKGLYFLKIKTIDEVFMFKLIKV